MSNVVPMNTPASGWTSAQISLIKRTVANDTSPDEFDLFVTVARNAGLDPFRKQISAIVFSKDNADKRKMAIITTIDGLRTIAARSGRYRPDEDEAVIEYDASLKSPTNPLGIVKAVVKIYVADTQREGGWKPVSGVAYWDEFAPVKEEWAYNNEKGKRAPTGKMTIDGNWPKMPRLMICKCAEAQALRKAFPDDMSSLYEGAEMDQARVSDLTPSEQIETVAVEDRLARIGGASGIMFQFDPNEPLETVPLAKCADRLIAAMRDFGGLAKLDWFESVNSAPLREFWARAKTDALGVKAASEKIRAELAASDAEFEDA